MKQQVSHRLDAELLARAGEYAEERSTPGAKVTRSTVIEEALRAFLDLARGGVPDLPTEATWKLAPSEPSPKPAAPKVRPSSGVFADDKGSRQQRLNAAMLRARSRS